MKPDYDTEARKLAKAVDIAIYSFTRYPPAHFTKENKDHFVRVYAERKVSILNPEPKFRKIASLKYHTQDIFTFFQEGSGEAVEYFWKQLAKENLGYVREDKLRKILDRGKIKDHLECDLVTDSIVAAEQDKRITHHEAILLGEMIRIFESRKEKKK